MIKVLVVEDYDQTRAGICDYLLGLGMEVTEASNTADALKLVETFKPHAVVLDIVIPARHGEKVNLHHGDGIRAAQLIKKHDPEIGIVFLSNLPYFRPEVLDLASQGYGGLVYLFKGEGPAHELRKAIEDAVEGRLAFDPQVGRTGAPRLNGITGSLTDLEKEKVEYVVDHLKELTNREWDILKLVAAARTNAGIARELFIDTTTVQSHLSKIYSKTGLGEGDDLVLLDKRALLTKAYLIFRIRHVRDER